MSRPTASSAPCAPSPPLQVVIFHPAAVPPDAIAEQLTSASGRYGVTAAGKALAAGLFLPIAFGIDIIILPGPQAREIARCCRFYTYFTAGMHLLVRFLLRLHDGIAAHGFHAKRALTPFHRTALPTDADVLFHVGTVAQRYRRGRQRPVRALPGAVGRRGGGCSSQLRARPAPGSLRRCCGCQSRGAFTNSMSMRNHKC